MLRRLHHKRVTRAIGAVAGLMGALSMLAGMLAAYAAPHGLARIAVALHISHQPLVVRLAPVLAGIAVGLAAIAGVLSFYSWLRERPEEPLGGPSARPPT